MKNLTHLVPTTLLVAILFVANLAAAKGSKGGDTSALTAEETTLIKSALIAKYDTNKNGQLDENEKTAMTQEDQDEWTKVNIEKSAKKKGGKKSKKKGGTSAASDVSGTSADTTPSTTDTGSTGGSSSAPSTSGSSAVGDAPAAGTK